MTSEHFHSRFKYAFIARENLQLVGKVTGHIGICPRHPADAEGSRYRFCHDRYDFRTHARTLVILVHDDKAPGLLHRNGHSPPIPGLERSEIDDLRLSTLR